MERDDAMSRRNFLKEAAMASAVSLSAAQLANGAAAQSSSSTPIAITGEQVPKRAMGKTGLQVSIMGLGGYHLGSTKDQSEANEIVARAIGAGVNFFDNCWEYHDGLGVKSGSALHYKASATRSS